MANRKGKITKKQLKSWKLLQQFRSLLEEFPATPVVRINKGGSQRLLTEDDYLCSFLFAQFNPIIDSMRGLCEASKFEKVQEQVCSRKMSLGSFSEAQSVFGYERLEEIFQSLAFENIHEFQAKSKAPKQLLKALRLVDSSVFKALPRMAWAHWRSQGKNQSAIRLHFSYQVLDHKAADAVISKAKLCERAAFETMIKPGEFYVGDRNYSRDYKLLGRLHERDCSFLLRLCEGAVVNLDKELEITQEDRDAGVVAHQIVKLGATKRYETIPLRLIRIEKPELDEPIILITNQLSPDNIEARLLAEIYRERWAIELFFKWLKCVFGKARQWHWFAESEEGVGIQLYSALIASLLLSRKLGKLPTKRMMEAFQWHQMAMISDEELEKVLAQNMPKKQK